MIFITFLYSLFTLFNPEKLPELRQPEKVAGAEFFLGYPRSGNNWTMAILQILTRRPIKEIQFVKRKVYSRVLDPLHLEIDPLKPTLYRTHLVLPVLEKIDPHKNKLLFVLRNYKECIVRECGYDPLKLENSVLTNSGGFKQYIDDLIFFDSGWKDEATKQLIYYEDLIMQPRHTVEKLLAFFQEKPAMLNDFFDNFEYWRTLVITKYSEVHHTMPSSQGDKKVFHTKDFPFETLQRIDQHIKREYPQLWEKYLSIYESK